MSFLVLLACAAESPLVGEVDTSSWSLRLHETSYDVGPSDVVLLVAPRADDAAAEGLRVSARPHMPDMDHLHPVATFQEEGPGEYRATLPFDMEGLWDVGGWVQDETRAEEFQFVVQVLP